MMLITERAKRVTVRGEEGSSNDGSKRDEEEWPLKEVVFLEDVKSVPLGRVLKVDGAYAAVRFPTIGKDGKVTNSSFFVNICISIADLELTSIKRLILILHRRLYHLHLKIGRHYYKIVGWSAKMI